LKNYTDWRFLRFFVRYYSWKRIVSENQEWNQYTSQSK
jgi:hypothetical protein